MTTTHQERTWRFGRTDEYPAGPWSDEPDKVQWVDEATGLDCLIVRNRLGALCGYVGVPPEHPWHGKGYDDESLWNVDVHGSLTFASSCDEDRPEGICHVPYPGRPGNVWWLGFDCAHAYDLAPVQLKVEGPGFVAGDVYRPVSYVKSECKRLARQVVDAA